MAARVRIEEDSDLKEVAARTAGTQWQLRE